ncbi:Spc97 / Spc98 family protein [Cryptosporidium felis]|nr:Spc97 / Spc98 family protein [Cryptosporidium felis]
MQVVDDNYSAIVLPNNILHRKNPEFPDSQKISQFWLVNSVLNSLFSSSNAQKGPFEDSLVNGNVFNEIKLQLSVILNNINLIRLNEKQDNSKSAVWRELGSCVTAFVIELVERWDLKLCELQHHHLNNCEMAFSELLSEFKEIDYQVKKICVTDCFRQKEDLWSDEHLFWEIESDYPFREFQFGLKNDPNEQVISSTPVTIIYLSSVLKPYINIWENIQSFFNILVRSVFLSDSINPNNVVKKRTELNIFVLEKLYQNIEKSILIADHFMINIWASLLRRCIESFIKMVPRNIQVMQSKPQAAERNSSTEFGKSISVLFDVMNYLGESDSSGICEIGQIFGIKTQNDIYILDSALRKIKFENSLTRIPIELSDFNFQSFSRIFPLEMLFKKDQSDHLAKIERRYTFQNNIGRFLREFNVLFGTYYRELLIKESENFFSNHPTIVNFNNIVAKSKKGIKMIDVFACLKDLVILEESSTEELIKALRLDSKKKFPNIGVDPTEVNLSIKLFDIKGITEEEKEIKRKAMSMFLLEFEVGNSKEFIKDQLPTYHSLKIRINNINIGSGPFGNHSQNLSIPNNLLTQFLNNNVLEEYSDIFGIMLEVKRSSIFLNQSFRQITYTNRLKQGIKLCRQGNSKDTKKDCDHSRYCDNNCLVILKWVESLLCLSQKVRYHIQFIVNIYSGYFSMQFQEIWSEFEQSLNSNYSIPILKTEHARL